MAGKGKNTLLPSGCIIERSTYFMHQISTEKSGPRCKIGRLRLKLTLRRAKERTLCALQLRPLHCMRRLDWNVRLS